MSLFFHCLVRLLDSTDPNWRKNKVVLLDNAPYHIGRNTLKVLEELRIPVLFTGPHSYDGAACELFFAAFKKEDINPGRIKTGKG